MNTGSIVRSLIGDTVAGVIDYYRFPEKRSAWGGPFNGQLLRQALFVALVQKIRPVAIIETGTYLGTTTEFMASLGIPVYSVEGHPRFFGFARARLWRQRHVTIRHGDSRQALRAFFGGPLRSLKQQAIFVYLDAHWNDDLPLAEELQTIFSECRAAVVMVDDFQVPYDPGYSYDDYGPSKALTPEYIARAVTTHDLVELYPAAPAGQDTGLRRGCVVLARRDVHGMALASLSELRSCPKS